jgi:PEP-CTERM motif
MWRDLGRHEALSLFVNDSALISGVPIPTRPEGVTSSNPYTLTQAIVAGGGGASSLLDISVTSGETVILAARRIDVEDFVGMNFTVNFTSASVPEPSTLMLMSVATVCGAMWHLRWRRQVNE